MDEDLLGRAIALSREKMQSDGGGPFGAVVARGPDVVADGWNQVTSTNDPTAHAEVVAIRRAAKALGTFDLSGCTLYASTEPCPMCFAAAHWARIDKIVFANDRHGAAEVGFDDALLHAQMAVPLGDRTVEMIHAPREEAADVLREWDAKPDKIPY
jgi:guanine deaminase